MKKGIHALEVVGNGIGYVLTILQTNETFQLIELIASIVLTLILIGYRVWKWYKEATKDGQITKEEIKDGIDIVTDGVNEIQDKIKKEDKKDEQNH